MGPVGRVRQKTHHHEGAENYRRGDFFSKLHRQQGTRWLRGVDNADCSLLRPIESLKQVMPGSITNMRVVLQTGANLGVRIRRRNKCSGEMNHRNLFHKTSFHEAA